MQTYGSGFLKKYVCDREYFLIVSLYTQVTKRDPTHYPGGKRGFIVQS